MSKRKDKKKKKHRIGAFRWFELCTGAFWSEFL